VNRLTRDNNFFLEFHLDNFFIKEQTTKKTILEGRCERGLYPLKVDHNKQVLGITKAASSIWHHRLGHPLSQVVQQVLSRHKIPFVKDLNKHVVYDACQKGKMHQLPYSRSSSVSLSPLELVFFVWGPASTSVGRHNYYVSFVDDYSKFTWIYLLRHKSKVFERFRNFQNLVERQFDKKILSLQTNWGGEY